MEIDSPGGTTDYHSRGCISRPSGTFSLALIPYPAINRGRSQVPLRGNVDRLLVTPSARNRRSDVPYWELFMPNHRLVAFGPGNGWSHRRSDVTPRRQSRTSGKLGLPTATAKAARAAVS